MRFYAFLGALLFAMSFGLQSEEMITDSATDVSFPIKTTVDFDGKTVDLDATGVATRRKYTFKIYSIASYLQEGAKGDDKLAMIMNPENAKKMSMQWVRDVTLKRVVNGYRETIEEGAAKLNMSIAPQIDQFIGFFTKDVVNGDQHTFIWLPNNTVEVQVNGELVGSIQSLDFAKALWLVWFGDHGVVNRNQLIGK